MLSVGSKATKKFNRQNKAANFSPSWRIQILNGDLTLIVGESVWFSKFRDDYERQESARILARCLLMERAVPSKEVNRVSYRTLVVNEAGSGRGGEPGDDRKVSGV